MSFETVEDIEAFYEQVNYSPQAWAEGVREIPRMFTTEVGDRWRERASTELSVLAKKRFFFRALAPLALRSNELIHEEQERLMDLPPADELSPEDRTWVAGLAADYGLEATDSDGEAGGGVVDESPDAWDTLLAELSVSTPASASRPPTGTDSSG